MSIPKIASYPMPRYDSYPLNKTCWSLNPEKSVLLVHDMQQYFLDFYDTQAAPIPTLIEHSRQLIQTARKLGIPIVYTAQSGDQTPEHRQLLTDFWGKGLKADPEMTKIHDELKPDSEDIVLEKWRYSAFKFSNLEERMTSWKRNQLVICGVYAHIGCLMSAAEAFMLNIQPFMAADALADFSLDEHEMALKYSSTRCAQVMSTDQIIQQWVKHK
ncbi:isochorismatase family protein [Acinetobacter shaoyimingii]|uniref:Isochorismatase family protein n=1 Tax=Acinetobacter shaoyimingii TaxID=2715164 RepID=A0A6G8RW92_9GAMM|nr:isochorismatase family protein [Acinetobacter shaoyimingii]QIO06131.1 isochorismatase family protein [Acinetobacter shaoyimingii]